MSVILFRSVFLYLLVVAAVRFMGKRQLGQLQPSEFVVAMILSDLATVPMQSMEIPLIYGIISILAVAALEVIISALSSENVAFHRAFSGNSVLLIKDGKIDSGMLADMRISIDDIYEEMRGNNITHIEDVLFLIVETNGNMNFISKETNRDDKDGFEIPVIKRGKIDKNALSMLPSISLPEDIKNILLYAADFGGNELCVRRKKV